MPDPTSRTRNAASGRDGAIDDADAARAPAGGAESVDALESERRQLCALRDRYDALVELTEARLTLSDALAASERARDDDELDDDPARDDDGDDDPTRDDDGPDELTRALVRRVELLEQRMRGHLE